MTLLDENPATAEVSDAPLLLGSIGDGSDSPVAQIDAAVAPAGDEDEESGRAPVNPLSAAGAALLSSAAVGWTLGGIFDTAGARLVGLLGAFIGAAVIAVSYRLRNPALLQVLALPLAILVGVGLVAGDTGGGADPLTLVRQAIKAGGLTQPPVPFDPGWRIVLITVTCALAVAASTSAVSFGLSRLAALLPAPVLVGGLLLQPADHQILSVSVSLLLAVGALAIAFGGELSRDGNTGSGFEIRRLGRAGGFLLLIVAAMVGLSQLGFLFPPAMTSSIIPPKRPQTPPPVTDHLILTATMAAPTPLRLGVLDTYDGTAWLTPPYDPQRFVKLDGGNVPAYSPVRIAGAVTRVGTSAATTSVTITVKDLGESREAPDVAGTVSVKGAPSGTEFDPRTGSLQLPGRANTGTTYTVTAAVAPNAAVLDATPPAGHAFDAFRAVPAAPPAVQDILNSAPVGVSTYERLQYVRTAYFKKLTAAGPGVPVDVTPAMVQSFLTGTPASPYEITAGEVLMARWAGVPARIGYGYYNDTETAAGGVYDIRSSDGALWLEAYFPGSGWTPILGKPLKATSSLDQAKKKQQQINANGEIQAQLYIPIRQRSLVLLYTVVQFYLLRVLPFGIVALFFFVLLPIMLKFARRFRRRRWAFRSGSRERIAVAYAEIRDRAIDFNVGHPTDTPLEFLDVLEPDPDHVELAWLVTRGVWGDLRRDLTDLDAEEAELQSRALLRRLNAGQPLLSRVVAAASRVSLRDPWSAELPNFYVRPRLRARTTAARRAITLRLRRLPRPRLRILRLSRAAGVFLLLVTFLSSCAQQADLARISGAAPLLSVPSTVAGLDFVNDPASTAAFTAYRPQALIANLALYSVKQGAATVATLQVASFKPGLRGQNEVLRNGVLQSIGAVPKVEIVAGQRFYSVLVNDVHLLVWFAPDNQRYELLVSSVKSLPDPETFYAQLVLAQQGQQVTAAEVAGAEPPADSRQGTP